MTEEKTEEGAIDVEALTADQLADIEASEKFILDFKEEDYNDPDKVDELRKHTEKAKTTIHQKRHFRDKVGKLEEELKPFKKVPVPPKPAPAADAPKDDPYVAIGFRQDHPELPKEVAQEVVAHAKAYGITPEEALAKPVIQSYIKSTQKQEDVDEASPASKNRGASGSGIEKRDWSTASEAEIVEQRRKMGV